jgi:hypothetical protein
MQTGWVNEKYNLYRTGKTIVTNFAEKKRGGEGETEFLLT